MKDRIVIEGDVLTGNARLSISDKEIAAIRKRIGVKLPKTQQKAESLTPVVVMQKQPQHIIAVEKIVTIPAFGLNIALATEKQSRKERESAYNNAGRLARAAKKDFADYAEVER